MGLHAMAEGITARLFRAAGRSESDVYRKAMAVYGIESALSVALGLALIIIAGWLCGALAATLLVFAASAMLRVLSGGPHLGTPSRCSIMGAVVYTALGMATNHLTLAHVYRPALWALLAMDIVLVGLYAPVAAPQKPLAPKQTFVLKCLSLVFAVSYAAVCLLWAGQPWQVPVLVGVTFQALGLSRSARWLVKKLDDFFATLSRLTTKQPRHQERRCGE